MNKTKIKFKKNSVWILSTVVLAILLIASIATGGFKGGATGAAVVMTQSEAASNAIKFLNENVLAGQATAELISITQEGSLYNMKMQIQGQDYDTYITLDGSMLFPSVIDLSQEIVIPTQEFPKTNKPEVQLFVMSMCPFGVQAEDAMFPVIKLLEDKVDFKLQYIVTTMDDNTFRSLHGQPEVDENLRQVAAIENYPDKYMDYILCQNDNYESGKDLGQTWEDCAVAAGIDIEVIKNSINTGEANTLLSANGLVATQLQVSGSPTIKINTKDYTGGRTPEAMKDAVCSAFSEAPEECETELSSAASSASGQC